MAMIIAIVVLGLGFWGVKFSLKKEKTELERRQELELAKNQQMQREQVQREQIQREQEEREQEQRLQELQEQGRLELQRREQFQRKQERLEQRQREREQQKQQSQKIPDRAQDAEDADSDHSVINFEFSYFFDQRLNSIIVIFASMNDLDKYKFFVSDSKEQSRTVLRYMQSNKGPIESDLNISENVELYLLPIFGDVRQFEKIADTIQEDEENILGHTLIHLNKSGESIGGKAAQLLQPAQLSKVESELADARKFLANCGYCIRGYTTIVYFKNQEFYDQVLEHAVENFDTVANFCLIIQKMQELIRIEEQQTRPVQLMLMPGQADSDEYALALFEQLKMGTAHPKAECLVIIDEQGEISGGLIGNAFTDNMPMNSNQVGKGTVGVPKSERMIADEVTSNKNYFVYEWFVYEWFIKETQEVFYVGMGFGESAMADKNDLFMQVKNKYPSECRYVLKNLTKEQAIERKDTLIKRNLSAGGVLTNVIVPMGYPGARSSAAEKTSYGARLFKYLETANFIIKLAT